MNEPPEPDGHVEVPPAVQAAVEAHQQRRLGVAGRDRRACDPYAFRFERDGFALCVRKDHV